MSSKAYELFYNELRELLSRLPNEVEALCNEAISQANDGGQSVYLAASMNKIGVEFHRLKGGAGMLKEEEVLRLATALENEALKSPAGITDRLSHIKGLLFDLEQVFKTLPHIR